MRLSSAGYYNEALPLLQETIISLTTNLFSENIEDNPPLDSEYEDRYLIGMVFYYKTWALRLKGLEYINNGDRDKGIQLLKKAIETGEIGLDVGNVIIDDMVGLEISSMMANEILHVVHGGMIHAAKSLREAKLQMLTDGKSANPRYWAPFVLIGE